MKKFVNKMKSGIYIIKNLINGKIYIGSAVNLDRRLKYHCWALRRGVHRNIHLQRAWDKDGKAAFVFEEYLACEREKLIFFEQLTIDAFIVRYGRENIYNISPTAGSTMGRICSEETKRKIGLKSKGRWTGKHHTEETKRRMSIAQKGRIITPEARRKLSISHKGKPGYWLGKKRPPRSEEWQEKLNESLRGHKMSNETKEKLRIANTGRVSPFKGKQGTRLGIKNKKYDY